MAGIGPEDLFTTQLELLAACEDALNTLVAPLEGAPDRSYVSPGQAPMDCCGELVVFAQTINDAPTSPGGLTAGRRANFGKVNHVSLVARITRCIPVAAEGGASYQPPDPADLQESAQQTSADAWVIWNHVYNLIRAGTLFSLCQEVFFDGMTALQPQGACAGWIANFRIQLDGYED